MALVIEDGTGVADAVSLATSAEADAFLTLRGISLPSGMNNYEASLLSAMDAMKYLNYKGSKSYDGNQLPFPRDDIGFDDSIPTQVKEAQIWLCHYISTGVDLTAQATPAIKKTKVDVIETEFAVADVSQSKVALRDLPNVYAPLKPFLKNTTGRVLYA